jgi:hypothetical protein
MTDILQIGADWLAGQLKQNVSQLVTYQRGADSVALNVTFGKDLLKLQDELGGMRMVWTDADLVFSAADLVLGGTLTTPQRFDAVLITFGAVVKRFEVFAEDAEPPWRWADQYQTMIRVHLKYLGGP